MTDPRKPIRPEMHVAADYALAGVLLLAPSLLRLNWRARLTSYLFGGTVAAVTALTDTPLAVKRVIPFPVHGQLDKYTMPVFMTLPRLIGATRGVVAGGFFNVVAGLLVGSYAMTAWDADPDEPQPMDRAREALANMTTPATAAH